MISKISKISLGLLSVSLIFILLINSEKVGAVFLLATGIIALVASILLANDIKKLNNSLSSKILSIILVSILLYSVSFIFYGLGNIGLGDKGVLFMFTLLCYLIFSVISIVVGIILVVRNKDNFNQGNPNKILASVLLLALFILSYTTLVTASAKVFENTDLCSMHIEIKENSFIFQKGNQDPCIVRVALDTSNVAYCKQVNPDMANICILNVARDLGDKDICYQIINDPQRQKDCIRYIAENKMDISLCDIPGVDRNFCYSNIAQKTVDIELCKKITFAEEKYHCYQRIATHKKDIQICEKYFPADVQTLINEGVYELYASEYSKGSCIMKVQRDP